MNLSSLCGRLVWAHSDIARLLMHPAPNSSRLHCSIVLLCPKLRPPKKPLWWSRSRLLVPINDDARLERAGRPSACPSVGRSVSRSIFMQDCVRFHQDHPFAACWQATCGRSKTGASARGKLNPLSNTDRLSLFTWPSWCSGALVRSYCSSSRLLAMPKQHKVKAKIMTSPLSFMCQAQART